MLKYGILGGTFDPVHNGHIQLAKNTLEKLNLDKVLLIPTYSPPHKEGAIITAPEHRLKMLEIAVENEENLEISDLEITRKGKSFTIDTISELKKRCKGAELYFIIGADMLPELHLWKDIEKVITEVNLVISTRPGCDLNPQNLAEIIDKSLLPFIDQLGKYILELPPVDISSTEVRAAVNNPEVFNNLPIPAKVRDYIIENRLYLIS